MAKVLRGLFGEYAVVTLLVSLNVLLFLAAWLSSGFKSSYDIPDSAFAYALVLFPNPAETLCEPWRVVTYMFTQFSWLHLLFNSLLLVSFAGLCRVSASALRVALLYLIGGLAGAFCYEVWNFFFGTGEGYLVGASGSIMAMMVWLVVVSPKMYVRLPGLGRVRALWVAMPLIVLGLIQGGTGSLGSFLAHLGGALAGLLMALADRVGHHAGTSADEERRETNLITENNEERLDALLDKIRISGYSSLSSRERRELDYLSSKLKK